MYISCIFPQKRPSPFFLIQATKYILLEHRICLSYIGNLHAVPYPSISCLSSQWLLYGRGTVWRLSILEWHMMMIKVLKYIQSYIWVIPNQSPNFQVHCIPSENIQSPFSEKGTIWRYCPNLYFFPLPNSPRLWLLGFLIVVGLQTQLH